MENKEMTNDYEVVVADADMEMVEVGTECSEMNPTTAFALGAASVIVGRFIYKKAVKPLINVFKRKKKKKSDDVIEDVEYVEVDENSEESDD